MEKSRIETEVEVQAEAKRKHYVLVHGVCHGAWCWYKLSTLLVAAGHRVTALDLTACGVNPRSMDDVSGFAEYSQPLTDMIGSLPEGEKVILVGHSFGGVSIALAMDKFPEKIEAAVFVAAFLPDCASPPSYVIEELYNRNDPKDNLVDTQFGFKNNGPGEPFTSVLFGPKCLASKLYQRCPPEDYTLATTLVRVGSLFLDDLSKWPPFSVEGYGSVKKLYVVCEDDEAIPAEFQRWLIANNPVDDVKEIKGADHMALLSKPQELAKCLLEFGAGSA